MMRRRRPGDPDPLAAAIRDVVEDDLCSGCGGCALISPRVTMAIDTAGFARPQVAPAAEKTELNDAQVHDVRRFRAACPGVGLRAPGASAETRRDPVFGSYVAAWTAWAADDAVRKAGSSAGVLSAIQLYVLERSEHATVIASGPDRDNPLRTAAGSVADREGVLRNAGSRYAPVAALAALRDTDVAETSVVVGKPCEASAFRQLLDFDGVPHAQQPFLLSFFCAGTPSQNATDSLVEKLGVPLFDVTAVRYRGDGWPGTFRVDRESSPPVTMSYNDSWGAHLGPTVQTRCKLCVDGTGGHADVAVGDHWVGDEDGFPTFEENDGNSLVVARTERGLALLRAMISDGAIVATPVDIESAQTLQPLQTLRKISLFGRLAGRRMAGERVPRYRGYHLHRIQFANIRTFPRALVGTYLRTKRASDSASRHPVKSVARNSLRETLSTDVDGVIGDEPR